ncbi:hypothetical protein ACTWP5_11575 [Streptomyces sp. 4N509B]|uniref:hypothetical protein n=1 Tax=Streptomyces sp. 4N509B TaxID=3457413 RepID=UPI003FD6BD25
MTPRSSLPESPSRTWRLARATVRLARHEVALYLSLLRWLTRRPPHGVNAAAGDVPAAYASGQVFAVSLFLMVSIVETVALAFLIPWPLVHAIVLVVDVWGILFIVCLHASCANRPHVVGGDGSLRVRYGALLDIRVPAGHVAAARLEQRSPEVGGLVGVDEGDGDGGTLDLPVGGLTNLTIELTEPVTFRRPLGRPARARVLRCYADDPRAAHAALLARV